MTPTYLTHDQLAEQAGHRTAWAALQGMKVAQTQAERLDILSTSLVDIMIDTSNGRHAALLGFAVALLTTLERGLGVHP